MSISASEIEKPAGGDEMAKRPACTEEYRKEAVAYHDKGHEESGKTLKKCAEELGVNAKTLGDWVARFKSKGTVSRAKNDAEAFEAKANKRIKELEGQVEFLKEATAFFASSQA